MARLVKNPLEVQFCETTICSLEEVVEVIVKQEFYLGIAKLEVGDDFQAVYNVQLRQAPTEERWVFACIDTDSDGPFAWKTLDEANFETMEDAMTCLSQTIPTL